MKVPEQAIAPDGSRFFTTGSSMRTTEWVASVFRFCGSVLLTFSASAKSTPFS
jgi:hypothetical protein